MRLTLLCNFVKSSLMELISFLISSFSVLGLNLSKPIRKPNNRMLKLAGIINQLFNIDKAEKTEIKIIVKYSISYI